MGDNSKLSEGFSYDDLARALLERLRPFLQEIIREELAALNDDLQQEQKQVVSKSGMIPTEPEVVDTGRYSATEASKILNIHINTLRRYTDEGLIRCGIRKSNGRKFYTGADIKKLWRAQY